MDIIAEKLGIDPVDLRLKNATRAGDIAPGGTQPVSCGLSECIEKVAEAIGWREKKRTKIPGRGLGIACTYFECGARGFVGDTDMSTAFVQVDESGVARVWSGGSDLGTGFDTVMSQIAAEVLGLELENVRITTTDTDITPFDTGVWASRATMMNGNAVKAAAEDARRILLAAAAEILHAQPSEIVLRDGIASVRGATEKRVPISDVAAYSYFTKATPILGKGFYDPDSHVMDDKGNSTPPGYCPTCLFAAEALEVEVDKETGEFKVLEVAAAHDCGFALNPALVEGQIEGGISRGLGMATNEGLRYDPTGKCINATFTDHKMFTAQDMPITKAFTVEVIDPKGPFGAKGVAQMSLVNAPPALSNAVYDAIGVRIKDLPITPEKILERLSCWGTRGS
jgi:CO/xanthine dehydrogenase Mo-binding subunit